MFLQPEIFKCVIKNAPLISIDFYIKKDNKYLLGKRVNPPAKGWYFAIGGRIFKNETIEEAQKRILKDELNIGDSLTINDFIGVFEHFYDDSIFGDDINTHYINLAYLIEIDDIDLNSISESQHSEYIWLTKREILNHSNVHKYVKNTLKELNE